MLARRPVFLQAPITAVESYVYRFPLTAPVRTSFGTMHTRPALFVRVADADGAFGWGETWCNFPNCGAEHRAALINTVLSRAITEYDAHSTDPIDRYLESKVSTIRLQSREYGPFDQCLAGINLALWDLLARRHGAPLWRYLGGTSKTIRAYASGINPEDAPERISEARDRGFKCFKLKVGFDDDTDIQHVEQALSALQAGESLAVDANQAWSLDRGVRMIDRLNACPLAWIEEPIRADSPPDHWIQIRDHSKIPLSAGENLASEADFIHAIDHRLVKIIQPDIAKWGGISACLGVAEYARQQGVSYYPHYLGGGIGLLGSAHLLAAAGAGILEVDCNTNPLRELTCGVVNHVTDGEIELSEQPGLGTEPDLDALRPWRVA